MGVASRQQVRQNLEMSRQPISAQERVLLQEVLDRCVSVFLFACFFLTRAPLGYLFNTPHWRGAISSPPPMISETTGPILKIRAAFGSPGKTVEDFRAW